VHEGVDFEKFAKAKPLNKELRRKYHIGSNYILFVGTLQPRKNLVRLINAFANFLKNSEPRKMKIGALSRQAYTMESTQLVIAGKPGWRYDEILEAPKRYTVEDKVVFTGRIKDADLPGLYKGSKAFILPSITEGFGLPVLEAQATGVPVVCSGTGALPEVAGNAAVFVKPHKIEEISQAIKLISQDNSLRKKLVKKGVENARSHSWKNTAYNTLEIMLKMSA